MKCVIYFLIFFFFSVISGPCLSQQVIAAAGTTATSTSAQLSWTIGEPVIETFTGTGVILTQGFHQSKFFITSIDPIGNPGLILSVYPNPVSDLLKLESTGTGFTGMNVMLYGMEGKLLLSKKVENRPELINMCSFPSGAYLLKVLNISNEPVQTFKIVKN